METPPPNNPNFEKFLDDHRFQLETIGLPQEHWKPLFNKLSNEIFDAGQVFSMAQDEEGGMHVMLNDSVSSFEKEQMVFLIDHAWTFALEQRREMLERVPGLLERLANLIGVSSESQQHENDITVDGGDIPHSSTAFSSDTRSVMIEKVLNEMWSCVGSYKMTPSDDMVQGVKRRPLATDQLWYVLDEFGTAIDHSNDPNFVLVPFYFVDHQCAYSLLWPAVEMSSLEAGDIVYRDHLFGTMKPEVRDAKLAALFPTDYKQEIVIQLCESKSAEEKVQVDSVEIDSTSEAAEVSNIKEDTRELDLPQPPSSVLSKMKSMVSSGKKIKVYSDLVLIHEFLNDEKFEMIVEGSGDITEADVMWPSWHIKDYQSDEKLNKILSQFENEKVLTCKDLLYETCVRANDGIKPKWLSLTFNMETEFPELIHEFYRRKQEKDSENIWICKPWNMSRGLHITIVNRAAALVKLSETGPKIACRYISNPVLFESKKFDIRYMVLLTSSAPLKLFVIQKFWPRFSNVPFTLDKFDEFERHFTTMFYGENLQVRSLPSLDFIPLFEKEYPDQEWENDIQKRINASIVELFTCVTKEPPPKGLGRGTNCRAMYGVDVMLEWNEDGQTINPVILEVNFAPDCRRMCRSDGSFWNNIFNAAVLDQVDEDSAFPLCRLV